MIKQEERKMNAAATERTLVKLGQDERKSIFTLAALLLVMAALLSSNLLLVKKNRALDRQLMRKGQQYLGVGDHVPTLRGLGLDGEIKTVSYGQDDRATLVFVFSPSCGWCKINLPNWQAILGQAAGRYRIVALSTSRKGTAEYVSKHGLSQATVIVEPEPRDLLAFRFHLTPQTILVDSSGAVRRNWLGAFASEERRDVESTLGVRLPDSYFETTGQEISTVQKAM
jgi:hypothetical protein